MRSINKLMEQLYQKEISFDQFNKILFERALLLSLKMGATAFIFFNALLFLSQIGGKSTLKIPYLQAVIYVFAASILISGMIFIKRYVKPLIGAKMMMRD